MSDEPRGPGPTTIMHSVSAWQRARQRLADDPELANDEAAIRAAIGEEDAATAHPDDLIRRAMRAMTFAELRIVESMVVARNASARAKRYERRAEALRTLIFELIYLMRHKRFSTPYGTISPQQGAQSVIVTDEKAIPGKYFRPQPSKLDKVSLLADLKLLGEDEIIPGALLSNGAPTIRITGAPKIILPPADDLPDDEATEES